MNHWFNCSKNK